MDIQSDKPEEFEVPQEWAPEPAPEPEPEEKLPEKRVKKVSVVKPKPTYSELIDERLWRGVIPVWLCKECGFQSERRDDVIEHVLAHLPEEKQADALENLLEE